MQRTAGEAELVFGWLSEQAAPMLSLLEKLVNTDSHTHDIEGVDKVCRQLSDFLRHHGIRAEATKQAGVAGPVLEANCRSDEAAPAVLIIGHQDTVFPRGEAARRPFRLTGNRAYGPGVFDMKAGLVTTAFVLAGLRRFCPTASVGALFTSDEEAGSPLGRELVKARAASARAVLCAEGSPDRRQVAVERHGASFTGIELTSRCDLGVQTELKSLLSRFWACLSRAELPARIAALAYDEASRTLRFDVALDLREHADRERARALVQVAARAVSDFGGELRIRHEGWIAPLVATSSGEALLDTYRDSSRQVAHDVVGAIGEGHSDAGWAAEAGTPTLCGIGPAGGLAHQAGEFIEVDTLVPRAQAAALTALRLLDAG